jgi:hypothetical protein
VSKPGSTSSVNRDPRRVLDRAVHGVLPVTYGVEDLHAVIAGGSADLGHAAAVLVVWGAGAMVATILAARAGRRWTLERLHPELVL